MLHRVEATVRPENAASRAVLAKVGFREEGLLQRYLDVDGAWRDHLLVAITIEELTGRRPPLVREGRALGMTFRLLGVRLRCRLRCRLRGNCG